MLSIACDKARFFKQIITETLTVLAVSVLFLWGCKYQIYMCPNSKLTWNSLIFFFYSSVVVLVTRCCCDFCCWYWIFFVLGQNECMSNYCLVPYHRYAIIKHGHNTQSQLKCNKAELRLLHRQPDHIVELWLRLLYASWCLLGIRECLVEYGAW